MAKNSNIEWTHHTFNPWWGCTKVSPACKHCYAETWAKRVGASVWGKNADRRFFTDKHWAEPLRWNREAEKLGERKRVFCASMADVFEDRSDLNPARKRLWKLIEDTPHLHWLLLTKRPGAVKRLAPWSTGWPDNVWLGTTIENQKWADVRLPHFLEYPAAIKFLSCEPLLGPVDLHNYIKQGLHLDWVIAGGESGGQARPMDPAWARDLKDQCLSFGIQFHFKQWGHWVPKELVEEAKRETVVLNAGEQNEVRMIKVGKKRAGRVLDGATWDGVPEGLPA